MEVIRFEVSISLLKERGGSAASAHKLRVGLVRNAPSTSLRECDWMEFSSLSTESEAELYIGAP